MSKPQTNYVQTGRIRSIKPEFFTHEKLFEAEKELGLPLRISFAGLWTRCDREGRFKWEPRRLKLAIVPYDECDFSRVLDALSTRGFIVRYEVSGVVYGWVPSFTTHQAINNREQYSNFPPPNEEAIKKADIQQNLPGFESRRPRVNNASPTPLVQEQGEGKGREGNIDTTTLSSSSVSPLPAEAVYSLPLRKGKRHPVTKGDVEKLQEAFPEHNLPIQFKKMEAWLEANPQRMKKPTGMKRFINNWLANEKQKPATGKAKGASASGKNLVGERKSLQDGSFKL